MKQAEPGNAAFDRVADTYDLEARANPSMRYMRAISLATLQNAFGANQRVLEIGCGTGEEAITLARAGVRVVATDPAAGMLAVTERRLREEGLQDQVQTRQLSAAELGMLLWEYGEQSFDGCYSSFGALNGEPTLRPVGVALAALVRPGGMFVASVMNRFHLFETAWYAGHGRLATAARRWRGPVHASVGAGSGETMQTWYYTPGDVARALAPHFEVTHCRALPFLLPPPYLASLWNKHPRFWERMALVEEKLAPRWPFRTMGDHFLIVLRRLGGD